MAALADPEAFRQLLDTCYRRNWVVYAKPPFGGPKQVFRYLGRYSHRVALSNNRLRSVDDTHVAFSWKDYSDGHRVKVMRLAVEEFIRRFLLHVLPKGFVRIRHYGLLASVNVATKLEECRRLLGAADTPKEVCPLKTWRERMREWTGQDPLQCPQCQGPLTRHYVPRRSSAVGIAPPAQPKRPPPAAANTS